MLIVKYAQCADDRISQRKAGKILRNSLLKSLFNKDFSDSDFSVDKYGKPFLTSYDLDFSVSHTAGLCAVAVCISEKYVPDTFLEDGNTIVVFGDYTKVGVDIEPVENSAKYKAYKRIAEKYFSENEIMELNQSLTPEKYIDDFTKKWTIKESICKMKGLGLRYIQKADISQHKTTSFINTIDITVEYKRYYLIYCAEKS